MFDRVLDLLISAWEWLLPFTVLDEYEAGIVLRKGRMLRTIGPGWHWIIPFGIDRALTETVVTDPIRLPRQDLTTADGVPVMLRPIITLQVVDVAKLLLKVTDRKTAAVDIAAGVIGRRVIGADWATVQTEAFLDLVRKEVRSRGFRYGVAVDDVQWASLQRARSYLIMHGHHPPTP